MMHLSMSDKRKNKTFFLGFALCDLIVTTIRFRSRRNLIGHYDETFGGRSVYEFQTGVQV
jgi:hypothetical protein